MHQLPHTWQQLGRTGMTPNSNTRPSIWSNTRSPPTLCGALRRQEQHIPSKRTLIFRNGRNIGDHPGCIVGCGGFVSWDSPNKVPQIQWLKQWKCLSSECQKSKIKVSARIIMVCAFIFTFHLPTCKPISMFKFPFLLGHQSY